MKSIAFATASPREDNFGQRDLNTFPLAQLPEDALGSSNIPNRKVCCYSGHVGEILFQKQFSTDVITVLKGHFCEVIVHAEANLGIKVTSIFNG